MTDTSVESQVEVGAKCHTHNSTHGFVSGEVNQQTPPLSDTHEIVGLWYNCTAMDGQLEVSVVCNVMERMGKSIIMEVIRYTADLKIDAVSSCVINTFVFTVCLLIYCSIMVS